MAEGTFPIVRANSAPRALKDLLHPTSPNLPIHAKQEIGSTMSTNPPRANRTPLSGNYNISRWLTDENPLEGLRVSAARLDMSNTMNPIHFGQADQSSFSSLAATATSANPSSVTKSDLRGAHRLGDMTSYLAEVGSWREDTDKSTAYFKFEMPHYEPEDIVPLLMDVRAVLHRMEAFLESLN